MSNSSWPSRRATASNTPPAARTKPSTAITAASRPGNTTVIHDVSWLQERHDWPGLKGVVIVDSIREIGRAIERETRLFITSLSLPAKSLAVIVRSHWAVENSLHWVMDMVFRDDECRIRTDHAPANFTTIKHMALNLTRRAPGKDSIRLRRKVAAWDDDYLASLIAA